MASGMYRPASNLDTDQCKHLQVFYNGDELFKLIQGEDVNPYEYIETWEKFEETEQPPKNAFYSKLNMKVISDQDNQLAHMV